jgi:hypothetical protein
VNMPRHFVAEVSSPERRRLSLAHTGIDRSSYGSLKWLGWEFIIERVTAAGQDLAEWHVWEESMLEILRYPEDYSDGPIIWRSSDTGDEVNLRALQPAFDASMRFANAIKTAASADGNSRLCFNLYDDGHYRFTLEERMREAELEAWVPRDWSSEFPSLEAAESAARQRFDWIS